MSSQGIQASTPYDEDEIVDLILDIYRALDRLGHLRQERDQVKYPPQPNGHVLDLSELDPDTIIDPRVLSLMRRLPAIEAWRQKRITSDQTAWDFTSAGELAESRNIRMRHCSAHHDSPPDKPDCLPTDMILFDAYEADWGVVILDVEANTIRIYQNENPVDIYIAGADPTRDDGSSIDWTYYRTYPTQSAPAFLRDLLRKYLCAELIPNLSGDIYPVARWFEGRQQDKYEPGLRQLQKVLLEDYKWPSDAFRKEDWQREGPALIDAAFWPDGVYM